LEVDVFEMRAADVPEPRLVGLPPPFSCTWREGGAGGAWAHLTGELDLATAPLLAQALASPEIHAGLLVLDLRGLTFMDSAGMTAVLHASARAQRDGRQFIVVRGPTHVDAVFTLTGTRDQVEMFDLDDAMTTFATLAPPRPPRHAPAVRHEPTKS